MFKVSNLSLDYGKNKVLDSLGLQAQPGEIHLVTGPSGSGKSSFLKTINGIIPEFSQANIRGGLLTRALN